MFLGISHSVSAADEESCFSFSFQILLLQLTAKRFDVVRSENDGEMFQYFLICFIWTKVHLLLPGLHSVSPTVFPPVTS